MAGILGNSSARNAYGNFLPGMNHHFSAVGNDGLKMEDQTLLVMRDAEGNQFDPLNDVSMGLGGKLLPDAAADEQMELSAFREVRDDAAGFEDALLQGD